MNSSYAFKRVNGNHEHQQHCQFYSFVMRTYALIDLAKPGQILTQTESVKVMTKILKVRCIFGQKSKTDNDIIHNAGLLYYCNFDNQELDRLTYPGICNT